MKKIAIHKIFESIVALTTEKEKIEALRWHINVANNTTMLAVIKGCFDPTIEWDSPKGSAPYKPCQFGDQEGMMYSETRRFYLFQKGGSPNLKKLRRETLWIELLQTVEPGDAEVLANMKDKKSPVVGLTKDLVNKAFPNLLPKESKKPKKEKVKDEQVASS